MSVKPISPLRARMVEDMTVRNFVPDTQREYIRAVKKLAAFLKRSPDTATAEELRAFQVHLSETGTPPPTMNATGVNSSWRQGVISSCRQTIGGVPRRGVGDEGGALRGGVPGMGTGLEVEVLYGASW